MFVLLFISFFPSIVRVFASPCDFSLSLQIWPMHNRNIVYIVCYRSSVQLTLRSEGNESATAYRECVNRRRTIRITHSHSTWSACTGGGNLLFCNLICFFVASVRVDVSFCMRWKERERKNETISSHDFRKLIWISFLRVVFSLPLTISPFHYLFRLKSKPRCVHS